MFLQIYLTSWKLMKNSYNIYFGKFIKSRNCSTIWVKYKYRIKTFDLMHASYHISTKPCEWSMFADSLAFQNAHRSPQGVNSQRVSISYTRHASPGFPASIIIINLASKEVSSQKKWFWQKHNQAWHLKVSVHNTVST